MEYMEKEKYPYNMMINNLCCIRITGKFGGVKNRERDYQDTEFRVMSYC
jgi:hypothetical protein